ncbi:Antioxidant 1 copper chaperone [Carabus blaptoides fortunei]
MEKRTLEFRVQMTCEGCSGAVKRVLDKHKASGIENVDINLKDQTVKVLTALPSQEVLEIIKKTGKSVEYVSAK